MGTRKQHQQKILAEKGAAGPFDPTRVRGAKNLSIALNVFAVLIPVSIFFFPPYHKMSFIALLVLPWVGLLLMNRSKGTVKVMGFTGEKNPNIGATLFVSFFMQPIYGYYHTNILDLFNAWWITGLATCLVVWLIVALDNKKFDNPDASKRGKLGLAALLFVPCFVYVFLVTLNVNWMFDSSSTQIVESKVIKKFASESYRSDSYTAEVIIPNVSKPIQTLSRPEYEWEKLNVGDPVVLHVREGALGIPWFVMY